tara:strand:+ start:12254 stop:13330 length:1077 start_codon:yes stop_codon:yes gene_type:complete
MVINRDFWKGRKVLITGHTGFKGSWLSLWLNSMGANVHGIGLSPTSKHSIFKYARIASLVNSNICDIRDLNKVKQLLNDLNPEIIFHMAAQPLVRYSYLNPIETYETNILGTVNILEASRNCKSLKAIVNITSDKCYENLEIDKGYKEDEPMGGHDPYSSSKACAELVSAAYRLSFLENDGIAMATARAGNVIGGGDWAQDRLIPDVIHAFEISENVQIRNPDAIRPWQHVLEPLSGYITLAEKLYLEGNKYAEGWNFGPNHDDAKSVSWIVDYLCKNWGQGTKWTKQPGEHPHEAQHLKLDISKAKKLLKWNPSWSITEALSNVIDWHKAFLKNEDMQLKTLEQINKYSDLISKHLD